MSNIYLIGMPGCGKSTIGKRISAELNMGFVDLDEYITQRSNESIPDMFEKGEKYFRSKEHECLLNVCDLKNTVIATGGGIVETPENEDVMKKSGTVVFIDTPSERILSNSSLKGRPLLADNKNKIFDIYKRRYNLYKKFSSIEIINDSDIDTAISKIMFELQNKRAKD